MNKMPCPKCGGGGEVKLPRSLREVLYWLQRNGVATAPTIQRDLGGSIGVTAFNNRLEKLRKIGMVTRSKRGKTYLYSVK